MRGVKLMVKKDRESMEELWSKRFDEEVDYSEEEPMSRKAKREREQSISPVLTVTVIFLALLIILPITTYAWYLNRDVSSEEPSGPNVEQVVKDQEDDESEEEPEEVEETNEVEEEEEVEEELGDEETEVVENTSEETEPESTPETDSSESVTSDPVQSESQPESAEASESTETTESQPTPPSTEQTSSVEPPQGAEYYTVQAGDNMYRIALNHGMSTEELMQLNNTQDETVYVGQQLRVR